MKITVTRKVQLGDKTEEKIVTAEINDPDPDGPLIETESMSDPPKAADLARCLFNSMDREIWLG